MRAWIPIVATFLAGCAGTARSSSDGALAPTVEEPLQFEIDDALEGLRLRLSEAESPPAVAEPTPVARHEILGRPEAEALLSRLPPLDPRDGDRAPFARRDDSRPPPRAGADVQLPFPPPDRPDVAEVEPAAPRVVRFAPEGDVTLAPHLSVTFSEPMVAIGSHDEASRVRPVTITPEPPGTWRWVGAKTLLFEPDPRFPMASVFTVEVPPDAVSAAGLPVEEGRRWSFRTPPPTVEHAQPQDGPHGLEPFVFLAFDQRVDAARMVEHVTLRPRRGGALPLRLATDAEIASEAWVRQAVEARAAQHVVVMKPAAPLAPATTYTLAVPPGAPSAEGPRVTDSEQRWTFRTYDPLRLAHTGCDRGERECTPGGAFHLEFNNPLDEDQDVASLVTVDPPIDGARVRAYGATLTVTGRKQADTAYTVRVSPTLRDRWGQALGKEQAATFRVGHAEPQLVGFPREQLILDPAGPPALSVFTTNHRSFRLRIYEVSPADFARVSTWMRDARYDGRRRGEPPAKRVARLEVPVDGYTDDELVETAVDLSPYLGDDGYGHLLVWLEPPTQPKHDWQEIHHFAWVQRTTIGLTALVDGEEIVTWATSLADGRPLEGARIELLGQPNTTVTGADGLATIAKYPDTTGPHALVARRGDDVALLPQSPSWWNQHGGWTQEDRGPRLAWLVFDDRKLYRPGEEVSVKGWLRRVEPHGGGLGGLDALPGAVGWQLRDSRGNRLGEGEVSVSDTGGFDLRLRLPDTPNLGTARLALQASDGPIDGTYAHSFEIQEFRRPEFEVGTTLDPRPYLLGEHAMVSVRAGYYAGGPLPSAPVRWEVTHEPATFAPPGHGDYRFGPWSPWWGTFGMWGRSGPGGGYVPPEVLEAQTDAAGEHALRVDFLAVNPPRPYSVRAEATVVDVNRQRWTRGEQLLLHPARHYVGLRADKGFYERGDEVSVEAIVTDVDGALVPGREVSVGWARLSWARRDGRWQEVEEAPVTCAVTSADEAASCAFTAAEGGRYRVRARVVDPEGRPNETVLEVWVRGGDVKQAPTRQVTMERLTLVPDAAEWQPGDTARILVQSPFAPAEGLLTIGREGVVETRRFTMSEASTTLEVPITDPAIPNLHVRVDVVGAAERRDDDGDPLPDKAKRVAFASGELDLAVPPRSRALDVRVAPRDDALDPGGSTELEVEVRDAAGRPVEGEVAVVVVDEAVLALAGYETPDPMAVFYAHRGSGVYAAHLREMVVLADPEAAAPAEDALGDDASGLGGVTPTVGAAFAADAEGEPAGRRVRARAESKALAMAPPPPPPAPAAPTGPAITLREDFDALALFAPHVRTGPDGRAVVPLTLPDSLTRYRILAVAVSGHDRFGVGESALTARKPVMLRPSPPRFLNFGDRAELPLVVQNQTGQPLTVDLAMRASNAAVLPDLASDDADTLAGRRLTVPPHDRREVRIPVAADMAGTARFQAVVAAGAHTDAAAFELPVWTPATTEAFATYGEVDHGAIALPVKAPDGAWPQVGGLEITTSSTALQALTDAVLYLVQYPYDCTEQIASRVLAVAALRDVLGAFEAEQLPSPAALEAAVDADLGRIVSRQHGNGGFAFWPGLPDEPYVSVHVIHALARAKATGFAVDAGALGRSEGYLRQIERHIPKWYGKRARQAIVAYALHVRHLLGDDDRAAARALLRQGDLPLEAQGWIAPLLDRADQDTLVRGWENRVSETAAAAQFATSYHDQTDYVLLHGSRRTDAVLLDALVAVRPDHDLIPKLVRGLLGHREAGRWSTTQENSFVLLALDRYFRTYEATTPDFVARVWLGDDFAGEHAFAGRTTERAHVEVPMAWLTDPGGARDLVLQKDGAGRLYYRVGLRYAPKDLTLDPADHGFSVERAYEAVDDPADVRRDADGTWRIRAGARVRVRLTLVSPARRTHVALVDPLPAGLEPLNPELATTGTVPADPQEQGGYWWWRRTWYEHQNLRDERAEAFTRLLWDGVHTYSYVATATTPGRYVVPPAKAEEMYHPETFGRTATDRVVVE